MAVQIDHDADMRCSCGLKLHPIYLIYGDGPYVDEVYDAETRFADLSRPRQANGMYHTDPIAGRKAAEDAVWAADKNEVQWFIGDGAWTPIHDLLNPDGTVRQAGSHIGVEATA